MAGNRDYEGSRAFPEPVVFEGAATFQNGIATGSVVGGQPPSVTTPSVPATAVVVTNTTGYDVIAYVNMTGVTATHVTVNGKDVYTAAISGPLYLPAEGTVSFTYSAGTPTWVWQAV